MPSAEKKTKASCLPTRYYVALVGTFAMYAYGGNINCFALVLTHVTSTDTSFADDVIFTNCTMFNSSWDMRIEMREDTMFLLHSTYFLGFFASRVSFSMLGSRFSQTRLMAAFLVVSNILTICLPYIIQYNIPLLFFTRLVQGLFDGGMSPLVLGLLSAWKTGDDTALLITVSMAGLYIAPAVAAFSSMFIMCYISWNGSLLFFGSTGILTGVVTIMTVYDTPEEHPSLTRSEVDLHDTYRSQILSSVRKQRKIPWRHIFTSVPLWTVFYGYFSRCFAYFIFVTGLGQYFVDSFNINIADISLLSTVPHVGIFATCILGGVLSDFLLKCGLSTIFTKKLLFTVGHLVEGVCLLSLCLVYDWRVAIVLLSVGLTVGGISEAGCIPLASDMAPRYSAETSGLVSTGTVGGMVGMLIFSALSGNSKGLSCWQTYFLICGLLSITSTLLFNVAATDEVQPWAKETPSAEDTTEKAELNRLLPEPDKSSSRCTNSDAH